ncbi:MAG TPA: GGDEF domain-containing protein [Solirubrobacterales bacterium]|jgi:diguanylate cyclase (GGDEF)-like protein
MAGTETDTTATPRGIKPLLALLLVGGTTLVVAHNWLGIGGAGLDGFTSVLYDAVVIAAGVACLLRARATAAERWAWVLIGLAILSWAAGEIYWTAEILDNPTAPYPSPADIGYLLFYPLGYAGLALLVRARAQELDWRLLTDGLIAALGTAALGTVFVFDFIAGQTEGTSLEVATSLAYPLGDIVMLSLVVGVIALSGWRPDRTWSLLLAGLGAMVVADIAFILGETEGFVPSGSWIDPIYLIAAAFLGAVLWQPNATNIRASAKVNSRGELMVPAIFGTVMVGLAAMQYLGGSSGLSTLLWMGTMIAVIVRLAFAARTNRALLEQVQTDPLTQLGNRGRMQVDLEESCAQADVENPAALYLFDLNGFKRYNDTFGHPAGDKLLTKLGQALQNAVGENGTAYRIGGDEFCVLLTCKKEKLDPLARRAAQALTESDRGVDVGASWGGALIPADADSPAEALQLADVRMYAQKESRRVSRTYAPQPQLEDPVPSSQPVS